MYTISTTPGARSDTAETILDALAALVTQLTAQLPLGSVSWCITDPDGTRHRGRDTLNGRLDLMTTAIDDLADELYLQLHRAADQAATQGTRHNDNPTT